MITLCGPRCLYPPIGLTRPLDLSLTTEDIDGARPRKRSFATRRCTDPLDPHYKLPSSPEPVPVILPSPIGTIPTNYIADIDRSSPKVLHKARSHILDSLNTTDIAYSQPGYRRARHPVPPSGLTNSLSVEDINRGDHVVPLPRNTNPLDPVYRVSSKNMWSSEGASCAVETIGPIDQSRPMQRGLSHPTVAKDHIELSSPQRFVGVLKHTSVGEGKPIRDPVVPTGSRASSLKRGLVSKRQTNPLDPNYSLLNGKLDSAYSIFMNTGQ